MVTPAAPGTIGPSTATGTPPDVTTIRSPDVARRTSAATFARSSRTPTRTNELSVAASHLCRSGPAFAPGSAAPPSLPVTNRRR